MRTYFPLITILYFKQVILEDTELKAENRSQTTFQVGESTCTCARTSRVSSGNLPNYTLHYTLHAFACTPRYKDKPLLIAAFSRTYLSCLLVRSICSYHSFPLVRYLCPRKTKAWRCSIKPTVTEHSNDGERSSGKMISLESQLDAGKSGS